MVELGYYFHAADNDALHGHTQLDVNIYKEPTEKHFDPETLTIWTVDSKSGVGRLTISHPYQGQKQLTTSVGRILLRDRRDKVVQAFSYGSCLQLTAYQSHTHGVFTSPAPIYRLADSFQDPASLVINELEALLAQAVAVRRHNGGDLKSTLARTDPFALFVAGLLAVKDRLRCLPGGRSQVRTIRAIDAVIQALRLEKKWPASPPKLSDLLKAEN